jgi:hypothetical protein
MRTKRSPKRLSALEPDFDDWKLKFDGVLRTDLHAARSWKRLADAGMDMEEVSRLLWLVCDFEGSPGYQIIYQLGGLYTARAIEGRRLAKRLEDDANRIKAFSGQTAKSKLTEELTAVVRELREFDRLVRDQFSARKLSPTVFREWLIRRVKEKTKRSFYKELSFLLDAAYEAYKKEPPALGADALRKSYKRFVENSSGLNSAESNPLLTLGIAFAATLLMRGFLNNSAEIDPGKNADAGWLKF